MSTCRLALCALASSMLLSGCVSFPLFSAGIRGGDKKKEEPLPQTAIEYAPTAGAIYREGAPGRLNLYSDHRARDVGDLLTIVLSETTAAQTRASTNTQKTTKLDMANPTIAGRNPTWNGRDILENEVDASRDFSGTGASSQSNSLNGNLTVTVIRRLPNGNLVVRGQKNLRLNQGNEFVQVEGVVREVDISRDNTVPSSLVADARISYNGRGTLSQSNQAGALARFFNSPLYPY
ncbi:MULTISPECIES: flagellar basal body L-ring protein FlgH [Gammaproteobacteria]|jgi:flagellar L-ring protein precursor FlgH|uniref:Flagellar L-ring protein n=1 Tax=Xanthomonas boreopolis TaxID=86183 RepID=A0A919KGV8_9XANT|nr:flagellar basal body L-ring protein FlgH [Pseudomonas sp. Hp2]GHH46395.1 flagellar L-ring protein [[Pseudomonas] boreopolis]